MPLKTNPDQLIENRAEKANSKALSFPRKCIDKSSQQRTFSGE